MDSYIVVYIVDSRETHGVRLVLFRIRMRIVIFSIRTRSDEFCHALRSSGHVLLSDNVKCYAF